MSGDDSVTFQSLSEMDNAPAFSTIRNKACPPRGSSKTSWAELRKQYRKELARESVGGNKVKLSVEQAIERTSQIINAAEMLAQHNQIAKGLLRMASLGINEYLTDAQKNQNRIGLKPFEIEKLVKTGIEIQRTIEGMATSKTEVDLRCASDAELDAIIDGNT